MHTTQAQDWTTDPRVELDIIGVIEGADKSSTVSVAGDYLKHYEQCFAEFRNLPINVMEVGIRSGASLRTWKWYFSNATIVGLDINPRYKVYAEDRVIVRIGSQADGSFLDDVCGAFPPSIFIDDGSHLAEHNIFTFEHVFPLLKPGGLYVVEDIFLHFGANAAHWQTARRRDASAYFLDLARSKLARMPVPGHETPPPSDIIGDIDGILFIGGAAIIRKRHAARAIERALAVGRQRIAERALGPDAQLRLASYVLRHNGAPQEAEAACREAIATGGRTLRALTLLAAALLRRDLAHEALPLLREAAAVSPEPNGTAPGQLTELARVQMLAGLTQEAVLTLKETLRIAPGNERARRMLTHVAGPG